MKCARAFGVGAVMAVCLGQLEAQSALTITVLSRRPGHGQWRQCAAAGCAGQRWCDGHRQRPGSRLIPVKGQPLNAMNAESWQRNLPSAAPNGGI